MSITRSCILPAAALLLALGCAPQSGPGSAASYRGSQCFRAGDVNSFSPVRGEQTVDVRVGASRYYRLQLAGACPDVDWTMRAAIRTRGGGSWICAGGDAEIIIPSPGGRQRCLVSDVRRISREQYRVSLGR